MNINSFDEIKDGLILALLGSDRPIIESLQPHLIDQREAPELFIFKQTISRLSQIILLPITYH